MQNAASQFLATMVLDNVKPKSYIKFSPNHCRITD